MDRGLTSEVVETLQKSPMRPLSLREVRLAVRGDAAAGEVNSILDKLVNIKRVVIKTKDGSMGRILNKYKWRLPSDGR